MIFSRGSKSQNRKSSAKLFYRRREKVIEVGVFRFLSKITLIFSPVYAARIFIKITLCVTRSFLGKRSPFRGCTFSLDLGQKKIPLGANILAIPFINVTVPRLLHIYADWLPRHHTKNP